MHSRDDAPRPRSLGDLLVEGSRVRLGCWLAERWRERRERRRSPLGFSFISFSSFYFVASCDVFSLLYALLSASSVFGRVV